MKVVRTLGLLLTILASAAEEVRNNVKREVKFQKHNLRVRTYFVRDRLVTIVALRTANKPRAELDGFFKSLTIKSPAP